MDEDRLYARDYSLAPEWAHAIDSSDDSDRDEIEDIAYPPDEGEIDPTSNQAQPTVRIYSKYVQNAF
jgi:hypothetical protein